MAEVSAAAATVPDEKAAEVSAPALGGRKKLILIIAAAVLLLGAVGGGAYFFMSGSSDEAADTAQGKEQGEKGKKGAKKGKVAKDAKEAKEAKGKKHKKPSAPAIYHKIDPALVVNFDAGGVTRFLQVAIEISTREPEMAEALKLHEPVIRNDLLLLFGSQNQETVTSREGKEKLRAQALAAVRNVIDNEGGEGSQIENVYFTSFVMQ